jgi:hypothetical protein
MLRACYRHAANALTVHHCRCSLVLETMSLSHVGPEFRGGLYILLFFSCEFAFLYHLVSHPRTYVPCIMLGDVSRAALLRLACQPRRPCPEAHPRLPQSLFQVSPFSAEIDSVWIPLRPSAPQRHPAQASMSVDLHRARGFPPGHSPSPPTGEAPPDAARIPLFTMIFFFRPAAAHAADRSI